MQSQLSSNTGGAGGGNKNEYESGESFFNNHQRAKSDFQVIIKEAKRKVPADTLPVGEDVLQLKNRL